MFLNKKKSFRYIQNHHQDYFENLGYRYWEKGILDKVTSKEIHSNPVHDSIYQALDEMLVYLINLVKQIRVQYSIAHSKDTIDVN